MLTLTLSGSQFVDLIKQLPVEHKRSIFYFFRSSQDSWWESIVNDGENELRQMCVKQGINWDSLSEDKRENL